MYVHLGCNFATVFILSHCLIDWPSGIHKRSKRGTVGMKGGGKGRGEEGEEKEERQISEGEKRRERGGRGREGGREGRGRVGHSVEKEVQTVQWYTLHMQNISTDPTTKAMDLTKAHLKYEPRYPTMFFCLHSDRMCISCCMMSKSSPLSSKQISQSH